MCVSRQARQAQPPAACAVDVILHVSCGSSVSVGPSCLYCAMPRQAEQVGFQADQISAASTKFYCYPHSREGLCRLTLIAFLYPSAPLEAQLWKARCGCVQRSFALRLLSLSWQAPLLQLLEIASR